MRLGVLSVAIALAAGASAANAAMSTVPNLGPGPAPESAAEPNRLTTSPKSRKVDDGGSTLAISPYLSLGPAEVPAPPPERRSGPKFLNADPFDPNSLVNRMERSFYANPYPYDPIYNPYGQGSSPYAPRGGANVPMGNGIPYRR